MNNTFSSIGDTAPDYQAFLESKKPPVVHDGIDFNPELLHPSLLPHQRDICLWAIKGGRRAVFADFGLGKTFMQLQILTALATVHGGRSLIICPLGVRQEFTRDARKFFGVEIQFVRWTKDVSGPGIYITNYESVRDGRLDPSLFEAVSLDEASVLRSYGSETFQSFMTLFATTRYRFVATATPDPNRTKELIHYAGFLGIMDTGQALTRFFQRDSTKANALTLYPHKEAEFWAWVHSWAVFILKPSELGYSDEGYSLPELNIHWHEVPSGFDGKVDDTWGQGFLFAQDEKQLQSLAKLKRETLPSRLAKTLEIMGDDEPGSWLIWHHLEDERAAIQKALPGSVAVFGSMDLDKREEAVIAFSEGKIEVLSTKPSLCGSGCNFQHHCHRMIFIGIDYKFNDFIQSIHRCYRFMQNKPVEVHIILTDAEHAVRSALEEKWASHMETRERMSTLLREWGLESQLDGIATRAMGIRRQVEAGESWTAVNADSIVEAGQIEDDRFGLIVTSIPFANHYEYSPNYADLGHTQDNAHFWNQMDYLTPNLLRILQPGRIMAWHVKDRILFGNVTGAGAPTVSPFHAEAIFHAIKHGFDYMGMITVVTDVVRENNQTYRLGWSENSKDGTKMGVGSPEYVLIFRKPQTDRTRGYADVPVSKSKEDYTRARWQVDAHAFWRSSGDRLAIVDSLSKMSPGDLVKAFGDYSLSDVYSYDDHVAIGEALESRGALPATFMSIAPASHDEGVWTDVNRMLTLNSEQKRRNQEMHICPLQFDIVDRIIARYSNPGDEVYDPFGGLMTVPLRAVKAGRRGYGSELNPGYWKDGCNHLKRQDDSMKIPTLFDELD